MPTGPLSEKAYREMVYPWARAVKEKGHLMDLIANIESFPHGYGTIVIGASAAMIGAFRAIDRSTNGGFSGHQAGAIAHEMIAEFLCIRPPYKIVHGDEYERLFGKKEL